MKGEISYSLVPASNTYMNAAQEQLYESSFDNSLEELSFDESSDFLKSGTQVMSFGGSFGEVLCKLWRFVLGVATAVVEGVAGLLKTVGKAVISLLGDLADEVLGEGGLFDKLFGSTGGKILLAIGAVWIASKMGLFGSDDDDDDQNSEITFKPGEY